MKRSSRSASLTSLSLTIAVLLVGSCRDKDGSYFVPTPYGPIPLVDITLPEFFNQLPATNLILSEKTLRISARDPAGATGEPVTGVNPATFRAFHNTQLIPSTRVGTTETWTIDISSIGEGPKTVNYEVSDTAGNRKTASQSVTTDWTPPALTWSGASTGNTSQSSATINLTGNYSDVGGITVANIYARQLVGNTCSPTAPLVDVGNGPGQVNIGLYQLPVNGSTFNINAIYNRPNGTLPFVSSICWHYHGEDAARGLNNNAMPNVTDRTWRFDQTWDAPAVQTGTIAGAIRVGTTPVPGVTVTTGATSTTTNASGQYTISGVPVGTQAVTISNRPSAVTCGGDSKTSNVVSMQTSVLDWDCAVNYTISTSSNLDFYRHNGPGDSNTCGQGSTNPPLPGGAYTFSWNGMGTVGLTSRSGTLNASGQVLDRQPINQFGTYTGTFTVNYFGVTRQMTTTVSVGGAQGTCPPP